MRRRAGWALATLLLLPGLSGAAPPTLPIRITTDTEEYCDHLAHVMANHPKASATAQVMASEGTELCAHGAVRAGISRLRRALLLTRGQAPPLPRY